MTDIKKKIARAPRKKREIRYENVPFGRHILSVLILSLCVTLLVEGFNQYTPAGMLRYLTQRTLYFLLNWLIIFASYGIAELFKRRRAVILTITVIWLGLGFANYVIIHDRTLPLVASDMIISREFFGLITVYLTTFEIIAVFGGGALLVIGIIILYSRTRRRASVNHARSAAWIATLWLVTGCVSFIALHCGWVSIDAIIQDRVGSFNRYGFTTSFVFTVGRSGIAEPEEYSNETVGEIMGEITETQSETAAAKFGDDADIAHPNVIFLQLESFFDVDELIGAEFSEDPTPNYHALLKECPNGQLYVPTIGGGTANVEFEVLSGMDVDFFGAGEVPYSTIISETTCESVASILRQHGYTATAMHNNTGAFYNRNSIYANLGFDRFDSLEYMLYPTYNRLGWAHDSVLPGEIMRALRDTDTRDMLFTISVESHGKYESDYTPEAGDVEVLSVPEGIDPGAFANYVNILRDVDAMLGEVIAELEVYDEPVLLVIYGDHLPGVGLTADMLRTGNLYASKYILWSNYGAELTASDMESYRLGSDILRQMDISDGVLMRFHQSYDIGEVGEEYLEKLETLEYDLLYGDQKAYGEAGAPEKTNLRMGLEPITIGSARIEYGRLLLTGENYTEYSKVICGERVLDTVFVDDKHLVVAEEDLPGDIAETGVCVAQLNSDGKELSRTEVFDVTRAEE